MEKYAKSYKGIIKFFEDDERQIICKYMPDLLFLMKERKLSAGLAYLFSGLESMQIDILYDYIIKKYRCEREMVWNTLMTWRKERKAYNQMFETLLGYKIQDDLQSQIIEAEGIRDKLIHGKDISDRQIRRAIILTADYMIQLQKLVHEQSKIKPMSDNRGSTGRTKALTKEITKWVLKGMGFPVAS